MGRSSALIVVAATVMLTSIAIGPSDRAEARSLDAVGETANRELGQAQRKARAVALAKCRKLKSKKRRKACLRRVKKKYRQSAKKPVALPDGPVTEIQVRDKYFLPDSVETTKGGSLLWIWGTENADPHNVTLLEGPRGVSPYDFETPLSPSVNYTFKRRLSVPGTYRFACSLHHLMRMTVVVKD